MNVQGVLRSSIAANICPATFEGSARVLWRGVCGLRPPAVADVPAHVFAGVPAYGDVNVAVSGLSKLLLARACAYHKAICEAPRLQLAVRQQSCLPSSSCMCSQVHP